MRSDLQGGLTITFTGLQLSNILKNDDFLLGILTENSSLTGCRYPIRYLK